jgi:Tfp pilus assembly protein PilN
MSNLLPKEGVAHVRREYLVRVVSVWAILLACASVSIAVFLFPTYLLVSMRTSQVASEVPALSALDEETRTITNARAALAEAMGVLSVLTEQGGQSHTHYTLSALEQSVVPDVRVEGITLRSGSDQGGMTLQIKGRAATRAALAAFVSTLEASPHFTSASVPVSDLARATDVDFAVTAIVAPPQ